MTEGTVPAPPRSALKRDYDVVPVWVVSQFFYGSSTWRREITLGGLIRV
jgi:hypothetical protein